MVINNHDFNIDRNNHNYQLSRRPAFFFLLILGLPLIVPFSCRCCLYIPIIDYPMIHY